MINYTESFNFKSIPAITPLDGYWQNGTWKFNMSEITAGASSQPSWQDIILSGNGSLTLTNAKANGLNYLKLFGGTEQTGTPTPDTPIDIVCNNGVLKRGWNTIPWNTDNLTEGYYKSDGTYVDTHQNMRTTDYYAVQKSATQVKYTYYGESMTAPSIAFFDSNKQLISATGFGDVGSSEYYTHTFTIPANTAYIKFPWRTTQTSTTVEFNGIYTDGTVETVGITGKNLFDVDNNLLAGYYINNTTGILTRSSDGSSSCFKDFLPSKPNITYTMSRLSEKSTSLRMWAYDKDKNPISSVFNSALGTKEVTGTTPNDTAYIRCSFGSIPQYSQNIQLELGSTATTYEPYFNGGSATAEMLLKVGNYKDVQSILDGGVTRNVGIEVLNGSEDWKTTYQGFFDAPLPNHIATAPAYCNYFQSVTTGTVPPTAERANKVWLGSTWVGLGATTKFSTVNTFKQWLADQYANGTPVIIVYPLATATTETVTPQPLSIQAGTNIVEITQASIDNLPLEVSYKGVI